MTRITGHNTGNSCTFPDYNEITDIYGVFLFNMSADDYSSLDDGNPILETGYYRFEMGDSKFRYINHYGNISFNFYNQLGQLVASIAPEGVKKLIENFHIYTNLSDIPFVNTYEYDQLGRLIAATSPDQGRSEYVYRIDGILRFSQNEEQKLTGKFSYTNYDLFNRPIESGEYLPGNMSFEQVKTNSAIQEDRTASGGLTGGAKTSWVRTHYDDSDNSHGKAGYIQNDLYLRDAVSWTENENAKTWYNYDEEGRVVWTITDISGLGPKTVDYSYNALGAVSKVDYQKDIAAERFVHEYEYDADGRLKRAYTALSQQNRKEQAHYHYYIHGPLKRVELAGNLQGIDYTYTPQGLLKTINHSDIANDPGKDGIQNGFAPDAFGMTLEYFPTDYTRAGTNIVSLNTGTTYNHYNGNISGQSWFSQKPETVTAIYGTGVNSPSMFTYEYDNKYQFLNNKFGAPNFLSAGFNEQANKNREYNLSYDRNGNIQALRRNDRNGNLKDDFVYHYQEGTNKLQAVDNYASYTYDKLGQLTGQTKLDVSGQSISIGYDVSGKVIAIYAGSGITEVISLDGDNSLSDGQQSVVTATQEIILKPGFEASVGSTFHAMIQSTDTIYSYAYDERGNRIKKRDHIQNYTTYYVYDASGNVMAIYDDKGTALQQKEVPVYAAGRIGMYNRVNSTYQYELTDHLGNVRVVLNQNKTPQGLADVVYYSDYYPYGMPMGLASNDYRYGYQGRYAEADKETAWNAFTLRNYDAAIGRWLSTDPYGQYASPYLGMGNNPLNRVDPDGGVDDWYAPEGGGSAVWIEGSGHQEGYKWLGGENYTFTGQFLSEVTVVGKMPDWTIKESLAFGAILNQQMNSYRLAAGNLFTGEYPNRVYNQALSDFHKKYVEQSEIYFDGSPTGAGALEDANWIIDLGAGQAAIAVKALRTVPFLNVSRNGVRMIGIDKRIAYLKRAHQSPHGNYTKSIKYWSKTGGKSGKGGWEHIEIFGKKLDW